MGTIESTYVGGDRFLVRARKHHLFSDQPAGAGGDDLGPTPTELFVAGLASCVGFYAERFLRRHALDPDGLTVTCEFETVQRPARVARIVVRVAAPTLPADRREAFERVVRHCTVHNSLMQPPKVSIELLEPARAG